MALDRAWLLLGCLVATMAGSNHLQAEETTAPSPGLVKAWEHYAGRVADFRRQNEAGAAAGANGHVILLGDSITEAFDVKGHFPGGHVLNRGISSDTIGVVPFDKDRRGVIHRLDTSVFDCGTSCVYMMIGVNDLGDNRTPEEMIAGCRGIVEKIRAKSPDVRITLQTLLPTRGNFARLNAPIREYNGLLTKLAAEKKCAMLDTHTLYADAAGELRDDVTSDGLHLAPAAYGAWADALRRSEDWPKPLVPPR